MAPKDVQTEPAERVQGPAAPAAEPGYGDIAQWAEAPGAFAELSTVGADRGSEAPVVTVEVVFSRDELHRLEDEAARAGTSVAVLVQRLAVQHPRHRAVASLVSSNLPSNPPASPETSSGIRVRGYSGGYSPVVGRNR